MVCAKTDMRMTLLSTVVSTAHDEPWSNRMTDHGARQGKPPPPSGPPPGWQPGWQPSAPDAQYRSQPDPSGSPHQGPPAPLSPWPPRPFEKTPLPVETDPPKIAWLFVGLGAVIALAAMMPWLTLGYLSVNGTSGDGAITLVMGLIVIAVSLVRALSRPSPSWHPRIGSLDMEFPWLSMLCLLIGGLTALIGLIDLGNASTELTSPGGGLVLTLLAGIALMITAFIGIGKRA
jgi:hypothetical protein